MNGMSIVLGRTSIFHLTTCVLCILLLCKGVTLMKMPSTTSKRVLENETATLIKTDPISLERHLDRKSALTAQLRKSRTKRNVMQMARMLKCTSGCNPLSYRGYGCYCGYMGAGQPVDGIDRCCLQHDWCYTFISCPQTLIYFIPYTWHCLNPGTARCGVSTIPGVTEECATELCECDREFAKCVSKYPCPRTKPECKPKNFVVLQTLVNNDI